MCSMLIKASGSKLNPNPHPPHLAFSNMHQFTTQCILYVIFVIWQFDFVTLILFLKLNCLWLYDLDIWHHWSWTIRDIVTLFLTLWPWNVLDIVIFTSTELFTTFYFELWPCILDISPWFWTIRDLETLIFDLVPLNYSLNCHFDTHPIDPELFVAYDLYPFHLDIFMALWPSSLTIWP